MERWLKQDLGVGPILIFQGEADGTVWWRYNMAHYLELFPGSEIFYLPEAGHQLANETLLIRQHYLTRVNDWVSRALSVY